MSCICVIPESLLSCSKIGKQLVSVSYSNKKFLFGYSDGSFAKFKRLIKIEGNKMTFNKGVVFEFDIRNYCTIEDLYKENKSFVLYAKRNGNSFQFRPKRKIQRKKLRK